MIKQTIFAILLTIISFDIFAENEKISTSNKDFNARAYFGRAEYTFGLGNNSDFENIYDYWTTNGGYGGIDISYKFIGFQFRGNDKDSVDFRKENGESNWLYLSGYYYGKQHSVEVYYQNIKGFYIDDSDGADIGLTETIIRNDINVCNFGLYYYYVLNPESFSFRAAFNQSEIQNKSGGSFAILLNPNYTKIEAKESLIDSNYEDYFENSSNLTKGTFTSLSVLPGFFYTITYWNYFFTPSFFLGGRGSYEEYYDEKQYKETDISLALFSKFSIGYNSEYFYTGFDMTFFSSYLELKKVYMFLFQSDIHFFAGCRF